MKLELRDIVKRFGDVVANDHVSLVVSSGEVLALLGENGAGKSTLMKGLYGFHTPDEGEVFIDDRRVVIRDPRDARALGIGMVFQQFSLAPSLTVRENLILAMPRAPFFVPPFAASTEIVARLAELLPALDPDRRAGDLSVGEKQSLELAKVLNLGARIIILDEPTSVLAAPEAERLYARLRALADAGCAVVLITHKLDDVRACADRVVVMRSGRVVGETTDVRDREALVRLVVGATAPPRDGVARRPSGEDRDSAPTSGLSSRANAPPCLTVSAMAAQKGTVRLDSISLQVVAGEIVGIGGVTGNGQELLGRVLAGVVEPRRGTIVRPQRIAYIPEQPRLNGCAPELSVLVNLCALDVRAMRWWLDWSAAKVRARALLERFQVQPRRLDIRAGALSGGNVQKLVVARELSRDPALVVACYPTMGLDLTATRIVVDQLVACANRGAAVVWISEEVDALLEHVDRVAVLHRGRLRGPVPAATASRQTLGMWMTGAAA